MIQITEKLDTRETAQSTLTLPFESRQKSRLRAALDDGTEVGLFLERGTVLRNGDLLRTDNGIVVAVRAADEELSIAYTNDEHVLARACYHLGNRHVPLQIGHGWVRYQHDHVLDGMVTQLGLTVKLERLPFEPEPGAYVGGSQHDHAHHEH